MKKLLLTLSALLFVFASAHADVVPKRLAEESAQKFFGGKAPVLVWETAEFYVFNNPEGGWIMISAEDAVTPVLAYSRTDSFDPSGMPSHVANWFKGLSSNIKEVRADKIAQTPAVKAKWNNIGVRTKAAHGKLIETANWDQSAPFNNDCAKFGTERGRAMTGCVATSVCIVMRYYEWPSKGTGTLDSYRTDTHRYNVTGFSIDDHYYDWSIMPLTYTSRASDAAKAQVAQVMHDVGVALHADYSYEGTGAFSGDIPIQLAKHFSYQNGSYEANRSNYSTAEWIRLMESEIDGGHPVLYGGYSEQDGGHAFVLDGYDENDNVHINWGWSGTYNAYYTLDLSIPRAYTFDTYQSAIINFRPGELGDNYTTLFPELTFEYYKQGRDTYPGLILVSGSIESGSPFVLFAGPIWNSSYGVTGLPDYKGAVKAALVDWKGTVKEYISNEIPLEIEMYQGAFVEKISCTITGTVEFGDRIRIDYKLPDGTWAPIIYNHEDGATIGDLSAVDACIIAPPASTKQGDRFLFEIYPGRKAVKSVKWYWDGTLQNGVGVTLTAGTHTVKAALTFSDGSTETVMTEISVN